MSFDSECERLERQSLMFGHDRAFEMVAPMPGTRLLDAGCGSGWLSRMVARRMPDCEVVGVDINPDYVAYGQRKAAEEELKNLTYTVGHVGELPFKEESFDCVWSLMLLMFLPDRRAAVADLARAVKPGGRLVTGQQGLPRHANARHDPGFEGEMDLFYSHVFPDWHPQDIALHKLEAGLSDLDVRMAVDRLWSFLGAATPEQLQNHRETTTPGAERLADVLGGPETAQAYVERVLALVADPGTVTVTGFWQIGARKT